MSDMGWVQLKNMVLLIVTGLCMYYVSGWCCLLLTFYTAVNGET